MNRQQIRKMLLFISFLLFPVTIYYFSPVLIIEGAAQGIIVGSFIVFSLMFLAALFLGRGFCGWLCPAGGMQEACFIISDSRAKGGCRDWIKYGIWVPWILNIVCYVLLCYGGGFGSMPSFVLDVFGAKMMPVVYGTILTAWGCGGIVGPQIVAFLKDNFAAQAAQYTFISASVLLLFGLVITFALNNKKFVPKNFQETSSVSASK